MNGNRKTARIVGILFITATLATSISQVLLSSILETPDFLVHIGANSNQFVLGILLELVNALASVGIAVAIFPDIFAALFMFELLLKGMKKLNIARYCRYLIKLTVSNKVGKSTS